MSATEHLQTITASDEEIRAHLETADIPSLMLALCHITGDMSIIRGAIKPQMEFLNPDDGLTDSQRQWVRDRALQAIASYRDAPGPFHDPTASELREMLDFLVGEPVADEYVDFLTAELSMHGEDPYAQPSIETIPEADRASFKVLIIGAGMSGILSAIRLKQAGIAFEIVEKNPDVGGTWYENTYPGCRVDSANHTYSYSFRPQDWPQHFSDQEVLRQYFADTVDEYDLRSNMRLNSEVVSASYDEQNRTWQADIVTGSGAKETLSANAIICAVGQLNRPNVPDISGHDDFHGETFHSARWRHDVDLTGKRVGVIGTGASAFQFTPIIAEQAASVTLFQRTPPWIVPNEEYFQKVPDGKHWLLNHVPFYARWFRFNMFWRSAEGLLHAVTAEDGWNRPEESVSDANQQFRDALVENLQAEFADHPDLLAKCTPAYPPGAKRALIDDGRYLRSLKRDNVSLLTDPIEHINQRGVVTESGDEHEFDVIVYATGFKASSFLFPMEFTGIGGKQLHRQWDGEPRAYKGISIPDFPNLFLCYGPNTNIVVNGSIIFFSECEVRYILGCLAMSMANDNAALNVRRSVHDAYNEWIDAGNLGMAWGQSGVNTWYKNARGHITQNWPFTLLEFWKQTRAPTADEFDLV